MQLCAGGFWEKARSMVLIAQYAAGVYEAHTGFFCVRLTRQNAFVIIIFV